MNEEQQKPEDSGKIAKQYDSDFSKLVALLNGKDLLTKNPRMLNSDVMSAMRELVKEEKEKMATELKEKVKNLIKKNIEFNTFVDQEQKKLLKALDDKRKEFSKEARALFATVEKIGAIETTYYESLKSAAQEQPVSHPNPTDTPESQTNIDTQTE